AGPGRPPRVVAALRRPRPAGADGLAAVDQWEGPAAARGGAAQTGPDEGGTGRLGPLPVGKVARPAWPRHLAAGRIRRRRVRPGEAQQLRAAPGPPAAAEQRPAAPPAGDQSVGDGEEVAVTNADEGGGAAAPVHARRRRVISSVGGAADSWNWVRPSLVWSSSPMSHAIKDTHRFPLWGRVRLRTLDALAACVGPGGSAAGSARPSRRSRRRTSGPGPRR